MPHYEDWVNSYIRYLLVIYEQIIPSHCNSVTTNISFDKFCKFIYDHSSGYITQYT